VIEDAIEGIDITVKGKTPKDKPPAEIGVEYDRNSVRQDIESFVSSYNQFYQVSKDLAGVDPTTGQKGPLSGDSTVRNADSRLKGVFSSSIEGAPDNLKSLTEFGITTTRQGSLEINYDMLDRQLNNNFDKLGEFFGGNNGFAKKVEDAIQGITGITGSIRTREKSLVEQNYRLVDDQSALDRRMDSLESRTHSKFTAMQDATSKMQSQLGSMMNALG
jgi:flagellar hook-associated protein 2